MSKEIVGIVSNLDGKGFKDKDRRQVKRIKERGIETKTEKRKEERESKHKNRGNCKSSSRQGAQRKE